MDGDGCYNTSSLLHLVGVYSKAVQYGSETACRHRGFVACSAILTFAASAPAQASFEIIVQATPSESFSTRHGEACLQPPLHRPPGRGHVLFAAGTGEPLGCCTGATPKR